MPSLPYTFANLPAGYSPLSYLDVNFTFLNQRIDAMSVTSDSLTGTSNTSNEISVGTKSFIVNEASRAWLPGAILNVAAASDPANEYLIGTITSYSSNLVTLEVSLAAGSGVYNSWLLNLTGAPGAGVPAGGASGQALVKASTGDGDVEWDWRVKGPSSAVTGNFPSFGDSSGAVVRDSGYSPASFATAAQGVLANGALQKTANLSDVAVPATALANIGGFPSIGGTITGPVNVSSASAGTSFGLNKTGSGYINHLQGMTAGSLRWDLYFGDSAAESGGNAGSNWVLNAFSDAGALLGAALTVTRSTLLMTLAGDPTAALGAATKQYADKKGAVGSSVTLSGTAIDITGLPTGVQKIELFVTGMAIAAGDIMGIRLGTSGGIVATGYSGAAGIHGTGSSSVISQGWATGAWVWVSDSNLSDNFYGVIELFQVSSNVWVINSNLGNTNSYSGQSGGMVTLGAALTTIRFLCSGGSAYAGGTVTPFYYS